MSTTLSSSGQTFSVFPSSESAAPISEALAVAKPGDTIVVSPGIYREIVTPITSGEEGKPIRIVAEIPGRAIVRGSEAVGVVQPGIHEIQVPPNEGRNPFSEALRGSRIGGCCGQVFANGQPLREVESEEVARRVPGTWRSIRDGQAVLIHVPEYLGPSEIELSMRDRLFAPVKRGMGHFEVVGMVFEHCANNSAASFWEPNGRQCGAVGFRAGHHITFRGNVIRHAKTIGIDMGIEGGADRVEPDGIEPHDNALIGNMISDNGECGACGLVSYRTRILNNRVERNANLSLHTVEEAGLKFHMFHDGLIAGNLIKDNDAAGIWLDAVWPRARVSQNLVLNNMGSGIFLELGADQGTVDHNIVAYTRLGDGIYTHDASDVLIAHNLSFGNAHFGIYLRYVTDRPFDHVDGVNRPAECSRNRILNNLLIDNYRGAICLPAEAERSKGNVSDYNHFINGTQWQWEGLGFHRFCLGDNDGSVSREAMREQAKEAGVSDEQWSFSAYLNLDQWRSLGYDHHSHAPSAFRITSENGAVVKGTCTLGPTGYLQIRLSPEAVSPEVPTLAGFDKDYFGRARGEMTAPGPFADLPTGNHVFDITPHYQENQP